MIPEYVKQLLHDIRLMGGFEQKYNSPDDWELIKRILEDEKERIQEQMEDYYRDAYW